jgi:hypothetical protein
VKTSIRKRQADAKRRIVKRMEGTAAGGGKPVFAATNIRYEIADKARGIGVGGIGAIHKLAGGVRALCAPVDNLDGYWAYMAIIAPAWILRTGKSISVAFRSAKAALLLQGERQL